MVSAGIAHPTSSSVLSSIHRKMSCISWKFAFLVVALAIVGCQSQTFQYSRGWTNGKRSGNPNPVAQSQQPVAATARQAGAGALVNQVYDDTPVLGISLDEPSSPVSLAQSSGLYRLFPNVATRQEGKSRSADYSQFLTRKGGNGSNANRKPPMWILGVEPDNSNNNNEDF